MASSSVVGALRISLGLDSAQFTTGMKSAQTGLQKFAGVAKAGALAIGSAMVAAGGAMALAMRGVINDADEMSKMAQSIGVPIEELSRLRYAADLSGVSIENLGKAIKRLSAGMLDASESATGPAARAFTMLGINVRDSEGKMRTATSVVEDLAARFARMPNGVEKTALAMRIFGKSGADMIPLLNAGSDGLREMYAEAEELGIVLDQETGQAAERFNDNLTRLGKVKDGIVTKITAGMLPSLEQLSASMVVAAKNSEGLKTVGRGLGIVMNSIIAIFVGVAGAIWAAGLNAAAFAKTMGKVLQGDFLGAAMAWSAGTDRAKESIAGTVAQIRALFTTVRGGSGALPELETDLEDVADATNRTRRSTERLTEAQREAQRAAAEMAREAEQVYDQTRTPAEQYAAEVARLTRLLNAAAISQDTFNRAMREAGIRRDADDPISQAGRRIAEENAEAAQRRREEAIDLAKDHEEYLYDATYDGVRGGLEAAADGNLGEYLARRIRDALFDNLATTITDMLRGPKGGGGGGGLAGWARAAGSMFKHFAGGFPGFATGGSFKVGGSPGKDKNFVGMNLSKGEMVDIRRPGQDRGGGAMELIVTPSPWFDVRAAQAAEPVAGRAGMQAFGAARSQVPADDARRRRFNLSGA